MKRTVIFLGILTLLVLLTLNRWDIRNYSSDSKTQIRTDRLTMQTQVLFPAKDIYCICRKTPRFIYGDIRQN